jgi:hypothetical protein
MLQLPCNAVPEFQQLSQRRAGWRAAGAKRQVVRSTRPFHYCAFSPTPLYTPEERVARHERDGSDPMGRGAVALSYHLPTIEFRLWQGTLNANGWLLRLGATHAVAHYALLDDAEAPLTWDAWVAWLHAPAQVEQYPEVVAWLARRAARAAAAAAVSPLQEA